MIEGRFGRATLIDCMRDPRLLLVRDNAAKEWTRAYRASKLDRDASAGLLALWPREILEKTQGQTNDRRFQTPLSHD